MRLQNKKKELRDEGDNVGHSLLPLEKKKKESLQNIDLICHGLAMRLGQSLAFLASNTF